MADFDAIVIGSGAGGSMAALAFAKKGLKVLVLEKGENYYPDLESGIRLRFANESVFGNDELKFNERMMIKSDPLLEPRSFRSSTRDDPRLRRRRELAAVDRRRRPDARRLEGAAACVPPISGCAT